MEHYTEKTHFLKMLLLILIVLWNDNITVDSMEREPRKKQASPRPVYRYQNERYLMAGYAQ